MPTVKNYRQQVETAALPGVRATAAPTEETFGVSGGNKLAAVGGQIYADEILKQDQIAVMEADRKLSDWEQKRLYDPKDGALAKRGKDAFGLGDVVSQDFEKASGEIRSSLTTERQRQAFDRQSETRRRDIGGTINKHTFGEVRKFDDTETENYLLNSRQAAVKAASTGDLARVGTEVDRQIASVTDYANRNGLGTEYIKQKTAQAKSDTHVGVVESLLAAGNDQLAKEYADKVKPEIAGDDIAKVDKWLKEGTTRGESQRQADTIMASTKSRDEAMNEAIKIKDPTIRDAVEDRVNRYYSIKKQAENENKEKIMTDAANIIDRTGSTNSISPSVWTSLSVTERTSLEQYAKRKAKGDAEKTDWATYYELMSLGSSQDTREAFARTNLLEYKHKLGNTEFKQLTDLQASIRKGDGKADEKLDGFRTNQQIVDDTLRQAGLDPTPKSSSDNKSVASFRRAVDGAVAAEERRKGKKLTNDEVQSIADNLVIKGKVPGSGWIWDTEKRAFELSEGESLVVKPKDIPVVERRKIEAALRKHNRQVTDQSVLDLYNLKLQTLRTR